MTSKIIVENLCKVFGPNPKRTLELAQNGLTKEEIFATTGSTVGVYDASFTIRAGEIFVIMGLSGSGKSTLVRLLNRLIEATRGKIIIDGRNILELPQADLVNLRRRDMAMVFQSFALLPHLTVAENAAFGLDIAGVDKQKRRKRALDALDQVGLKANADSYPDALSGGMQQRVGLARALATDPSILLMDEAFSALDPLIRREMQEELLKLQARNARTIVFISHDLDEAMRIGDRIAIMEAGRVLQVGTPREILERPSTHYVRAFFKEVDIAQVYTAGDLAEQGYAAFNLDESDLTGTCVLETLEQHNQIYGYVIDNQGEFRGVVSVESLRKATDENVNSALMSSPYTLRGDVRLSDALGAVANTKYSVPVINDRRQLMGTLSRTRLLAALDRNRQ